MRFLITLTIITAPLFSFSQTETVTDIRDGKEYRITSFEGVTWMLDNMNIETQLSVGLSHKDVEKFNLSGRYYHMYELDSVCPARWRLPNVLDWIKFFEYTVNTQYPNVNLEIDSIAKPVHYTISEYSEAIDLFNNTNPLKLRPTGRIEGGILNIPTDYADYWTIDNNEEIDGRTHIHIMNPWTTIHSHKHHLKPKKENELRKFMVRCVT